MDDLYRYFDAVSIDSNTISNAFKMMQKFPNEKIMINFPNTKHIKSSDLDKLPNGIYIRIQGGYTFDRINNYKQSLYVSMHKFDNIYTIDELKKVLTELERIESNIPLNWSNEQKAMYFINTLKNNIIYHPKYETQPSHEIRSLRGLYSRKTVCAGYAMILKELCDRNDVECEYTEGACNKSDYNKGYLTHAWNILKLNGNYFPIDLTWNAGKNSEGLTRDITDLFNTPEFIKTHIPGKYEKVQDYEHTLKSLNGEFIKKLLFSISSNREYNVSNYMAKRSDGSKFLITQAGNRKVNDKTVHRYIYNRINEDGSYGFPVVIFSTTNISMFLKYYREKEKLVDRLNEYRKSGNTQMIKHLEQEIKSFELKGYTKANSTFITDVLFSKQNLQRAMDDKSYFIGAVAKDEKTGTIDKVIVDLNLARSLNFEYKHYTRSDGTKFLLQKNPNMPRVNNHQLFSYELIELIYENNKPTLRTNSIYTDEDLFLDDRKEMVDVFLSRKRIDRKQLETDGYLGYFSKSGIKTNYHDTNIFFENKQKVNMSSKQVVDYYKPLTFEQIKSYIKDYQINLSDITRVKDLRTGKIITDELICNYVAYANIWKKALNISESGNTSVIQQRVFMEMQSLISQSIVNLGYIDTVTIHQKLKEKYSSSCDIDNITTTLFRNNAFLYLITKIFRLQNPNAPSNNGENIIFKDSDDIEKALKRKKQIKDLKELNKDLLELKLVNGKIEISHVK